MAGEPRRPRQVFVDTKDLIFRSKVRTIVASAGDHVTTNPSACDLAVIELDPATNVEPLRPFVERGTRVLAFASHVQAELLRQARDLGAEAVPNSGVETRLRALLTP
ncbi:MAG TPA: hypothetical protein VH163_03790 [Gemmatimonadales bacterium]|nr:hypothetical protein [Gemmatimonadales bacterium]